MWKRSISIGAAGVLLAALLLLFAVPEINVAAAGVNIVYYGSAAAEEGQIVEVEIELSGDVVFTTLGLRLNYDSGKLLYEGEQWTPELQSQGTVMTLISDVEQGDGKALNISAISNDGYRGNGTMLTLRFTVKESYTENPFRLELREITDNNMQSILDITEIKYQNTGAEPKPEEPTPEPKPAEPTLEPKPEEPTPEPKPAEPTSVPSTAPTQGDSGSGTGGGTNDTGVPPYSEIVKPGADHEAGTDNVVNINRPSIFQTGLGVSGTMILCIGGLFVLMGILCIAVRTKLSE